jgi:uncharacterized membrane protein
MIRVRFFIIAAIAALFVLVSSAGVFLPPQTRMYGGQGMMGSTMVGDMLWPSTLFLSAIVLILVIVYLLAFPPIKYSPPEEGKLVSRSPRTEPGSSNPNPDSLEVIMRVLKPDEKAALEVVRNAGGVCMQKDITYKTGLSKLRTHRVVARLAERGVIQVRKLGKTNEITVPAWLKDSANAKP